MKRAVAGPVQQWDIRAMHPYLLATERFPVRLIGVRDNVPVAEVLDLCNHLGVIARVTLRTRAAEYPVRVGQRVVYPVGRFTTTLAGPELQTIQADGEILKCHTVATYHMGRPFVRFAEELWSARRSAERIQDATGCVWAKLLANSLTGKLAQRRGGWTRAGDMDAKGVWGERDCVNVKTGSVVRHRWIAGLCWRWGDDKLGGGPYTFAFAYLTAYGRVMMRRIREMCPARSVVSQDTDGIWTLPDGTEALTARLPADDGAMGRLRKEDTARNARFFGPRHYWTDGTWTLSGLHRPAPGKLDLEFWDTVETPLWSRRATEAPSDSYYQSRQVFLKLDLSGGVVQPDGWVSPLNRVPKTVGELDELDASSGNAVL